MTSPTQHVQPEGFSEQELAGWRSGRLFAAPQARTDGPFRVAPADALPHQSGFTEQDTAATDPGEPVLYVPDQLPEGRLGLVVLLHGAGSTPADVLPIMEDQARREGFLLLAPKSIDYTWDIISGGGFGPDVAALDSALAEVFDQFDVDPDRVAVAGISDGASYALSLGLANGSLFKRVVAFSPGYFAQGRREGRPQIFVSHGREDRVLPIDRTSWKIVSVLRRAGYAVDFQEFTGGHEAPAEMVERAVQMLQALIQMIDEHYLDFSDRVAVVTGAGSRDGIGFATAVQIGRLGAAVALGGTTPRVHERVEELRAAGVDAIGLVGDLTEPAAASALAASAMTRWGRIDVLVNNAGMVSAAQPDFESGTVGDMSLDTWHRGLARNLDTAFLMTAAVAPIMQERHYGRIVMVASVTGPVMAMRADIVYAAAKAGVTGLVRALAVDLAVDGVTVNAVAPGWIATGSQTGPEYQEGLQTPVGRSGTPEEVASSIVWLASSRSSYVTGQCVNIDGGNSVAEQRVPRPTG